jgi:hypothetical protein
MTLEGGGGGPSGPATSTTVTSNIPEYAEPYVTNMLDLTQRQLFKMDNTGITGFEPYRPYSATPNEYFAGFSPLQKQAQIDAGAMQQPGQFALGSGLAGSAGIRSLGAAGQYAQDVTNKQRVDAAGKPMFDVNKNPIFDASNVTQSFMSPYQQAVTDAAKSSAMREAQMAQNAQNLGAARTGTYGGARQLLANTERERNLLTNLTNIQTQGNQSAYDRAMQTQQFGANLGMQGYGQALGAGAQLGQLGATQQATDIARQNQMAVMGGQQQALEQNKINQAIQDYSTQQQYPLMQLGFMSNMLRGLPMEGLSRQTYAPQPSFLTQGIGTIGALGSLGNVFKGREGGLPKEFESTTGIKSYNVGGSVESKLQDMNPADLQDYIKETSSPMARRIAEKVLRDKVGRAGGGIIAFSEGKKVKEDKEDREDLTLPSSYDKTKKILPELKEPGQDRREFREALTNFKMPNLSSYEKGIKAAKQPAPEAPAPELVELSASVPQNTVPTPAPAPAESKAAPATTGGGTGIKAVPSGKIMPTAGLTLPSSLDAPFGLEAPVNPDANKTIAQMAAEKEAYMGPNIAAQQERARLMAEKSNARDEASRVSSMRMAEFFAAWGSTPGNTIVAGLNTLKSKIPDFINDQKEETRIRRAIDKDIFELEKIDRLEKSGNYDQAAKLKTELSKNAVQKYGVDVKALSDANQTAAYREVGLNKAAGSGGEDKNINNLLMRAKGIEDSLTAYKKANEALIKRANLPGDTPEIRKIRADAQAKLDADPQYKSLMDRKAQVDGLLNQYKKIREANESTSDETKKPGAPGTAGNPIVLK